MNQVSNRDRDEGEGESRYPLFCFLCHALGLLAPSLWDSSPSQRTSVGLTGQEVCSKTSHHSVKNLLAFRRRLEDSVEIFKGYFLSPSLQWKARSHVPRKCPRADIIWMKAPEAPTWLAPTDFKHPPAPLLGRSGPLEVEGSRVPQVQGRAREASAATSEKTRAKPLGPVAISWVRHLPEGAARPTPGNRVFPGPRKRRPPAQRAPRGRGVERPLPGASTRLASPAPPPGGNAPSPAPPGAGPRRQARPQGATPVPGSPSLRPLPIFPTLEGWKDPAGSGRDPPLITTSSSLASAASAATESLTPPA